MDRRERVMPCRICTANDQDALEEDLARAIWDAARDHEVYEPWHEASAFWQNRMRLHARTMIGLARDDR